MKLDKPVTFIGFKMSGKTTLACLVAEEMASRIIDTDRLLEESHFPLSCREVYQKLGEADFRKAEHRVIHFLDYQTPFVLATGGGTLLLEESASLLAEKTTIIYLKVSPQVLKDRIWAQRSLPSFLLCKDPEQEFERLYHERVPLYVRWAGLTIDMDGMTIEQSLRSCMELLNK